MNHWTIWSTDGGYADTLRRKSAGVSIVLRDTGAEPAAVVPTLLPN